jgi:hypothetical protein
MKNVAVFGAMVVAAVLMGCGGDDGPVQHNGTSTQNSDHQFKTATPNSGVVTEAPPVDNSLPTVPNPHPSGAATVHSIQ